MITKYIKNKKAVKKSSRDMKRYIEIESITNQ